MFTATAALVLLLSVPFFWVITASFKPVHDIFAIPPKLLPWPPTLENYLQALERTPFPRYFFNSVVVATSTTLLNLLLACPAAYAFARFTFPGRRVLLLATLVTQLFPAAMLLIPLYRLWATLDLFDTYQALIATYLAFSLPLSIWLLTAFFRTIPPELEDAARIDGCSRLGSFWWVVLPLSRPGLAASAVYIYIGLWQEFLFAISFTTSREMRTLPVALFSFIGEYGTAWNHILAAAVMMTIPVVVLFALVQRQFVQGLTAGGVK